MKLFALALLCVSAQAAIITGAITGGTIHVTNGGGISISEFDFAGDSLGSLHFRSAEIPFFFMWAGLDFFPDPPGSTAVRSLSASGRGELLGTLGFIKALELTSPVFAFTRQTEYTHEFTLSLLMDLCNYNTATDRCDTPPTHLLLSAAGVGTGLAFVTVNQNAGFPDIITVTPREISYEFTSGSFQTFTDADVPEPSLAIPVAAALLALSWCRRYPRWLRLTPPAS